MSVCLANLYDTLFCGASVSESADGTLLIRSAPSRYVLWVVAFIVLATVSGWCWRRRLIGRWAPSIFFASFLFP